VQLRVGGNYKPFRTISCRRGSNTPQKSYEAPPLKTGLSLGAVVMLMTLPAFGAPNPDREAYYGETHVHTSWSLDAWLFGNRLTDPGDAYKYFTGETIKHPLGFDIKIDTPPRSEDQYIARILTYSYSESTVLRT
jgi:hypothetical protein